MKLAIFLPNWIGDVVMATPALRAIRNEFPSAEIVGVMRPYVTDVLAGTGLIDRELHYNPRGKMSSQRDIGLVRRLRAEHCDTVLLLPNSLRSGLVAWFSGARRRVGFARDLRGWLLTDRVNPKSKSVPHPVMDEYLRLAARLGCRSLDTKTELAVLPQDQARLDEFWSGRWVLIGREWQQMTQQNPPSYVCLNTGGAFGAAKNWPREYFATLARRIAIELNKTVLVVCGPSERDDARWIAAKARHPSVLSLAELTPGIGLTKAAIRAAELLVTTDSGPRHFAAPFGTPVITLFGPTHIEWSETHYDLAENLQLKLDCGPCQQRECPLKHHRCMRELSVESVYAAVQRQLLRRSSLPKVA